jgi:hypothetical protein
VPDLGIFSKKKRKKPTNKKIQFFLIDKKIQFFSIDKNKPIKKSYYSQVNKKY